MEMRVHEAILRVAEMLPFGPLACRSRSPLRLHQTPVPQPNSNNLAHVRLPAAHGVRHTEKHHPITILGTTTLDLLPRDLDGEHLQHLGPNRWTPFPENILNRESHHTSQAECTNRGQVKLNTTFRSNLTQNPTSSLKNGAPTGIGVTHTVWTRQGFQDIRNSGCSA